MPELPEVEVVRAGLAKYLVGKTISGIKIHDSRSVRGEINQLEGQTVTAAVRRGKFLWLRCGDSKDAPVMVAHLRMSGQLLIDHTSFEQRYYALKAQRKHEKVTVEFRQAPVLTFVDQRVFGYLGVDYCVPTEKPAGYGDSSCLIPASAAHIARDFLDPYVDDQVVIRRWRSARRPIKAVLLDQYILSGMGNIYTDEALFRARLDPRRRASALTVAKCREILAHSRDVLREAIRAGGTSFDELYLNAEGAPGYFARALKAYGRVGKPCLVCGATMERLVVAGRGSHVCPQCQPYRRGRSKTG